MKNAKTAKPSLKLKVGRKPLDVTKMPCAVMVY
jgi:hypothetical protein